jgi:hypothetical protein
MSAVAAKRSRTRLLVVLLVVAGLLVFAGANAHLLYAALTSQPECMPHLKVGHGGQGTFSAADSAC